MEQTAFNIAAPRNSYSFAPFYHPPESFNFLGEKQWRKASWQGLGEFTVLSSYGENKQVNNLTSLYTLGTRHV